MILKTSGLDNNQRYQLFYNSIIMESLHFRQNSQCQDAQKSRTKYFFTERYKFH